MILGKIVLRLFGNSQLAEIARFVFMHLRLYWPYNKYYFMRMRNATPVPETMIKSQDFYEANNERVDYVESLLADDLSKETFRKLINLRQFYRDKDIPKYNYFNQYFPTDIISFMKDEVFVDGGAFTGDTIKKFRKCCPHYNKVIAFEPDRRNVGILRRNMEKIRDIHVFEAGLSDKDGKINFFIDDIGMFSKITEGETGEVIQLVTIDNCSACKDATFIKMDIEGEELPALKGAENTIKNNKPKLAICIYHSNEDMLRIAEYLRKIVPEYELYVRAHNMGISEAVLYAVYNKAD